MATIVQETGSGSASSNSYVTAAELSTYATDRGVTLSGTASVLLIQAMDYLEQMKFQGYKYTEAQALQWPRSSVMIDSFAVGTDEIPQLLKDAQCEIAIGIDGGVNPLANEERETRREKVGEIEVEYSPNGRNETYLKAAHNKLQKLLKWGGVASVAKRG